MEEYLELASQVIPNFKRLKSVQKSGAAKDKKVVHWAALLILPNGHCDMYIKVETSKLTSTNKSIKTNPVLKYKKKRLTRIFILSILAHELSHLQFLDHSPKRQLLESQIMILFMSRLHENGYTTEEDEEKSWKNLKKGS